MATRIFREKAGVISEGPVWVCIHRPYLYTADTLFQLLMLIFREWEDDRHLVG